MDLRKKTFNAIRWTTLATFIKSGTGLMQMIVLARILVPYDFGLIALVTVVIGFSQAFLDMGISNAVIHKQEIDNEQLSTLYWLNIITGAAVFSIIAVISPFIAKFYREPQLEGLMMLVGLTLLIQPFGQLFAVLWQKELKFKSISLIEMTNSLLNFIISVILALLGYGVYALVWGILFASILQTIQFLIIGIKEYKPAFIFKITGIKEFLKFGLYQMGERTLNYFIYQFDVILIGKLLGTAQLGIYNIAKQLVMYPAMIINPIITRVTLPAMAKIQDDIVLLKKVYKKTINYLCSINFPIYAFIFVFSNEIITMLYGEKWFSAVPLLSILAIWAAFRSTGNPIGSLLMARGKAKLGFWWVLGVGFFVPIIITIGSRWGLAGIGWSLIIFSFPFGMIANWYFLVKNLCGARFVEYHLQILIPAFFSFIAVLAVKVVIDNFLPAASLYQIYVKLIMGGSIGFMIIFLLNYVFNRNFLLDLKEMLK